ncbi:hypoxanthine phosphoribosyltransferase [Allofustis seminis]|uniref:hypoxanthine phosphoribosyltransferase n=1 Tax=Allofustis seminis TaxID=166939 RepID=UPI0003715C72|nr:hypoxanthine phosphoribosyltransferase [Allofustis seminis]
MEEIVQRVLISEEEIKNKVHELGRVLSEDYRDKNPLLVGVLKGALPFMADLMMAMDIILEYDVMDVSSYGSGFTSSGEVKILKDLDTNVEGRHIIFVEDIVDTGLTLKYLVDLFKYRKAASVKIVTLLDKPSGRKNDFTPDYYGFKVPGEFLVGYGLDFKQNYRNLPFVGVVDPKYYQ